MSGSTTKSESIFLGIVGRQPYVVFLSNISIYSSKASEEIISLRHCRVINNVCHGREGELQFF